MRPQKLSTTRGPELSFNLPTKITRRACVAMDKENAPEIAALVQPRSPSIGFKKTPKELYSANMATMMKNEAETITYP